MLDIGDQIRLIIKKKGLKQKDVVELVNEIGLVDDGEKFHKEHMSMYLNGKQKITPSIARRFELVLGIEKNYFVNMLNLPISYTTEQKIARFERIYNEKTGIK